MAQHPITRQRSFQSKIRHPIWYFQKNWSLIKAQVIFYSKLICRESVGTKFKTLSFKNLRLTLRAAIWVWVNQLISNKDHHHCKKVLFQLINQARAVLNHLWTRSCLRPSNKVQIWMHLSYNHSKSNKVKTLWSVLPSKRWVIRQTTSNSQPNLSVTPTLTI